MEKLKQIIESTLINNLECESYEDNNNIIKYNSIQDCTDYISKEIQEIAIEFAQWLCDAGWESNPPIWSNGEYFCDLTRRSTYTECTTEELFNQFITDRYKEQ